MFSSKTKPSDEIESVYSWFSFNSGQLKIVPWILFVTVTVDLDDSVDHEYVFPFLSKYEVLSWVFVFEVVLLFTKWSVIVFPAGTFIVSFPISNFCIFILLTFESL